MTVVAALVGGLGGCVDNEAHGRKASKRAGGDGAWTESGASAPAPVSASASASAETSARPLASAPARARASASAKAQPLPTRKKPAPCPNLALKPTSAEQPKVDVYVSLPDRHLSLERGGPAREFTLILRNYVRDYGCLKVVFTTETNAFGEGDPALTVERRDPATGRWVAQSLVVANDIGALLAENGAPFNRGEQRTERWRIRANTPGPTGTAHIQIKLVATDVPARDPFAGRDAGGSWFTLETARGR
ncbi:hypothetical protein AB0C51_03315 [Streptomyces pathocidini]|uniref:hypothetical protein n=1 Tax=Streptomyces pathocidini TaxID=1650571 RepID=UPI0033E8381F